MSPADKLPDVPFDEEKSHDPSQLDVVEEKYLQEKIRKKHSFLNSIVIASITLGMVTAFSIAIASNLKGNTAHRGRLIEYGVK